MNRFLAKTKSKDQPKQIAEIMAWCVRAQRILLEQREPATDATDDTDDTDDTAMAATAAVPAAAAMAATKILHQSYVHKGKATVTATAMK